jgi:hypothetical protein
MVYKDADMMRHMFSEDLADMEDEAWDQDEAEMDAGRAGLRKLDKFYAEWA